MERIRVLVVEDSRTVRAWLCQTLADDADLEVVGEAGDGQEAIDLCARLRPHVVTMDMMLPGLSGLDATEHIMAHFPTPILIVSASTNRGELFRTYDALAAGAVDVLEKPGGDGPSDDWRRAFVAAVKLASRIRVITHLRGRRRQVAAESIVPATLHAERRCAVIGLGASTGGPAALVEVLSALPRGFAIPILLVLHIAEPFASAFAEWLSDQVRRRVAYARHGDAVDAKAGEVVMAPPGRHLVVSGGRVRLTSDGERHSCRPSIDVLFESMAVEYGASAAAGLLTGMGRDGAAGLLAVRRAGGVTVAQDAATSVVYGMPREAALIGAASQVLPLGAIGPALAALADQVGGRR